MYKSTNDDFLHKRMVSKLSIVKRQIIAVRGTISMNTYMLNILYVQTTE
jgi:hypothetical protein